MSKERYFHIQTIEEYDLFCKLAKHEIVSTSCSILRRVKQTFRRRGGNESFAFRDGRLYHNEKEVIPRFDQKRREEIISNAHIDTNHGCRDKTFARLNSCVCGVTESDVNAFISKCTVCLQFNAKPTFKHDIIPIAARHSWEHVEADFVDLRFCKERNEGFCWILTMVDHFSRFAVCVPCTSKCQDECFCAIYRIFCVVGIPQKWHSDNGREFVNALVEGLLKDLHVDIAHGKPRKPSTQGSVERFNRTLVDMLGKHMRERQVNRWIDIIDTVTFQYNARKHEATGCSPFFAMFNREGWSLDQPSQLKMSQIEHNVAKYEKRMREKGLSRHKRVVMKLGDTVYEKKAGQEHSATRRKKFESLFRKVGRIEYEEEDFVVVKHGNRKRWIAKRDLKTTHTPH